MCVESVNSVSAVYYGGFHLRNLESELDGDEGGWDVRGTFGNDLGTRHYGELITLITINIVITIIRVGRG